MTRKVTLLDGGKAPAGADPTTALVQSGDLVNSTGILGIDPKTGALGGTPEEQFHLAFQNLATLMEKAGLHTDNVGLVSVFIPGPDYRNFINPGWLEVFPDENNRPARKTNHVKLPEGVFVQLQVAGVAGGKRQRLEVQGLAHRDPLPNGVKIGNMVYSSVIVPQDLTTSRNVEGEIPQIEQAFSNTKTFMDLAGASLDNVVHMWVFLSNFDFQKAMVDVWVKTWPRDGDRPARKTLRYPMGGLIQVQATGVVGGKRTNYEIPGVGHADPIPMGAKIGNVFYSSGISGTLPDPGGQPVRGSVEGLEPQIKQAEANVRTLLEQAGGGLDNLALLTVLISDAATIPAVQRSFEQLFPDPTNRPGLKFIDWNIPTSNGGGSASHVQYHVTAVI
jgi:2-iminobutanoate/2-iminopropanoate deaminase